jgi:hypothetical protein
MPTIVDPDDLTLSSQPVGSTPDGSVYIDPTTTPPTIQLIASDQTGGFGSSPFTEKEGVSLQALYSFLKLQWKQNDTDDFFKFLFPMEAITSEQFEFINNWEPADDATRSFIRTGGWTEKDAGGTEKQSWMGVITLGNILTSQQPYFAWYDAGTTSFLTSVTNFSFAGIVNEPVQVYGDTNNGNFDYRTKQLFVYIRPDTTGTSGNVVGYTYDLSTTAAIGTGAGVTYQVYRFPLSTVQDLNLTLTDSEITTLDTNKTLRIRFDVNETSAQLPIQFGSTFNFTHTIDADTSGDLANLTPAEVYNFVQFQLRQNVDIDDAAGTRTGKLTEELVKFVGTTLETLAINGATEGVMIDNFDTNETANLKFSDNGNVLRAFPVISSGIITLNDRLRDDPATRYWMFYTTANSGTNVYPGANALIVTDYNGDDVSNYLHISGQTPQTSQTTDGSITAASSVLTSTAGGLSPSAFIGKVLRITAGNNIGFYFITANTANTITIDGVFEATDASNTVTWSVYNKNANGQVSYTFDYDNAASNRGDGLSSVDAGITLVALGLDGAQYVTQAGSIGGGAGQNFSVNAALERNFSDPL